MGPASCLRPRAPRYAPSRFKVDALAGFVHAHAPSWYPKDTDPTEKSHLYEAEAAVLVSKHVVVRRLLDKEKDTMVPLAFANNARAGLFVNELMNYARTNREGSSARHLFVQAPKLSEADGRETTLIDESVYSRNRSFHLLFQSKFAKNRRLELDEASGKRFFRYWRPHPTVALLETMVTFVPPKTELFRRALIPESFGHTDAKSLRVRRAGPAVARDSEGKVQVIQQDPLLNYLGLCSSRRGARAVSSHTCTILCRDGPAVFDSYSVKRSLLPVQGLIPRFKPCVHGCRYGATCLLPAPELKIGRDRTCHPIVRCTMHRGSASILTAAVSNRQSMQYLPGSSRPPRRRCCPQQTDSEHVRR